ncbi:MAG TPA: MFS transporter [Candidimonas sp.]|nr:MFS transporter [Candidimonas sp.]
MKERAVPSAQSARKPVRSVLLACMLVLLVAQALVGSLSLSALSRLIDDNTAERVQLVAGQTSAQIQSGLQLGKPLAQYFGLSRLLQTLQERVPDMSRASVVLSDGQVLAQVGGAAMQAAPGVGGGSSKGDGIRIAVPLGKADAAPQGSLIVVVKPHALTEQGLLADNIKVLALTTLGAALLLFIVFRFVLPVHAMAAASKARLVWPLAVLLLAQGVYAAYTIGSFRDAWIDVTRENAKVLGASMQSDLNRVLAYGIAVDRLEGVERPMARLAASFPVLRELRVVDAAGTLLYRAGAHGALDTRQSGNVTASQDELVSLPLTAAAGGKVAGQLQLLLDGRLIQAGVRARIMDAATVAVVALVAAIELLLLLTVLMDRAFAIRRPHPGGSAAALDHGSTHGFDNRGLDDPSAIGQVVRPVMFGFLFAMAMPLSFLPIYARGLLAQGGGHGAEFLMALPIAAEMGCGLLTALLAGRLIDRQGWQAPVLAGLGVAMLGSLACAFTVTLAELTLARGLVGLGYGLAWMGLQGFIVTRSPAAYRGRNMATIIAGLFAGHLSGAAVGSMLMQQAGSGAVFIAGAALLILPAIGVFTLMWPYRGKADVPADAVSASCPSPQASATGPSAGRSWASLRRLMFSRDFGLLLVGCVVPFSIAQVGLLSYALPLYLEAHGATAASVGRILMLYGLCVIYIGPYMGRLADHSPRKKQWIVLGGFVGSAGLLSMYFASGVAAATVAVLLLALASCLVGGAQTAYMLGMDRVQHYGAGGSTSVMRAADKFGQMLGPLLVGGLFATMGISGGLAVTGGLYLAATMAFLTFAPASTVARS